MNKPPIKIATQSSFVHAGLRMPPELRQELRDEALRRGCTMNAVIIDRLLGKALHDKVDNLTKEVAELKAMMKELLAK